ncbi:MAG: UDP-N-acetylmuramoyl-L-alanine--D-glutamate ligase [Sulfurimonadaceae bacterium]|jgi:UDP-N-acetylmuramoylalanine--D-glutamate ligase|nr:UDP-N-acetylmuramoyl-L-alanine--D-glutamate ligase [Sulfurimonadaceae bacterium]
MKRISLFGYGKTTKAIAKKFPHAIFYDDKATSIYHDNDGFEVRPASLFNPLESDVEIPSPGIPPENQLIQKAKNLVSDYDFFAHAMPFTIWISGTNGKTTTTQMMQHLLRERGSLEGGNIGTPVGALDTKANIWVLETSSFTIHYTNIAKPNLYILLPLSQDHISWHGSMQEYVDAKLKPLRTMQEGEIAIIPERYKDTPTNAHLITYKDSDDLASYFGFIKEKITFKGAFLEDALLAMAAQKILFGEIDYEKINAFVLEAHRQEELYDSKGRLWVNDTKATNLDATIAACKRYEESFIHLILGGDDKGADLEELFVFIKDKNLKIYTIGSNKTKLNTLAKKYSIHFMACTNLRDAVTKISLVLQSNETALLSPAAASLDEYSSYIERGEEFRTAVKNIS